MVTILVAGCVGAGSDSAPTTDRLDLGDGVVVAFVEDSSNLPEFPDKVAYVTHVPSGSQVVLDSNGQAIVRHDGRGDGPGRFDAVLADEASMERITEGLQSEETTGPGVARTLWVHSFVFGGIIYQGVGEPITPGGENALSAKDLGSMLYRVAFRGDGHVGSGYRYQDGDATYLNPGTPVYEVKGYAPRFRLGTLMGDAVTPFEADTNPLAKTGEDLLDIRGKVTAIDVLSEEDGTTA